MVPERKRRISYTIIILIIIQYISSPPFTPFNTPCSSPSREDLTLSARLYIAHTYPVVVLSPHSFILFLFFTDPDPDLDLILSAAIPTPLQPKLSSRLFFPATNAWTVLDPYVVFLPTLETPPST